jgi:S1-C subfamily serine protease
VVYLREVGSNLERRNATLRLGERPSVATADDSGRKPLPIDSGKADARPFGLTLVELTPAVATTYKLDGQKGLLVKDLNPESFLADVKTSTGSEALGEGDVIQRINRVSVADTKSFASIVNKLKKGDAVVLHVVAYNPSTRAPQLKIVQFTVQ